MVGAQLFPRPCGLADTPIPDLGDAVVGAWDDFLAVAHSADLTKPSRLPGWTGRDLCIHLGTWDDHDVLPGILTAARNGGGARSKDAVAVNEANAALIAAHSSSSAEDVLAALQRSRDALETWFEGPEPSEMGRALVRSAVGELPLLSLLSAGCYELAVHALDLRPCGAEPPSPFLLSRGLGALIDVTGALAARHAVAIRVTAQTPTGGWSFTASELGWASDKVTAGAYQGVGVRGSIADLLDVSAGRLTLPSLLLTRRLTVQHLPQFMRLAPILSEVPGLPGGAALKAGVGGLSAMTGGVGKLLGKIRR